MKANNIRQFVRRLKDEEEADEVESRLLDKYGPFSPRKSYHPYKIEAAPKGDFKKRLVIYGEDNRGIAILRGRSKTSAELVMRDGGPGRFDSIGVSGLSFPQIIRVMEENLLSHKVQNPAVAPVKITLKRTDKMEMKLEGDILTITINTKQDGAKSASGKSIVIESTRGNVTVPGTDLKLGLNLYRPVR